METPGVVPKYIKATKNPGTCPYYSRNEKSLIPFSAHMLVSHGFITTEIWLPTADTLITMHHNCPRRDVCDVVTCKICRNRWINVKCYNILNYLIKSMFALVIAIIIICITLIMRTAVSFFILKIELVIFDLNFFFTSTQKIS